MCKAPPRCAFGQLRVHQVMTAFPDSGSGLGSLGDLGGSNVHDKPPLPGGASGDSTGSSLLSSPKAGSSHRKPQTSTPKKTATKSAEVSPTYEKPSDKFHSLKANGNPSGLTKEAQIRLYHCYRGWRNKKASQVLPMPADNSGCHLPGLHHTGHQQKVGPHPGLPVAQQ